MSDTWGFYYSSPYRPAPSTTAPNGSKSNPSETPDAPLAENPSDVAPDASDEIRPEYYGKSDPYEPWKIITARRLDFFLGNALKYLLRAGRKSPDTYVEDLDKAITYLKEARRQAASSRTNS